MRAILVERVATALERFEAVQEAYLFGSSARGEATAHSDVDVAVHLRDADLGSFDVADVTAELIAALGTNAVDLVVLNRATPLLYHRVLRDGIRLFARDLCATTTREGRALSRFCDYVPQLAKIDRVLAGRIARGEFGR